MRLIYILSGLLLSGILLQATVFAQNSPEASEVKSEVHSAAPKAESVVTQHRINIHGKDYSYSAKAATCLISGDSSKPKASIFFVAYTLNDVQDVARRPITFCFNGGPGAASVWLHLGNLGPKIIATDGIGYPTVPNRLQDNPETLLATTDLVFVDPVSTGFSRTVSGEDPKQFHNFNEDIASVAEVIRLYLSQEGRWESPKFIVGESYGTVRAAGLAGYLFNQSKIYLDGVILISSALDMATLSDSARFYRFLPTYAAIAWYFKRLEPEYQKKDLTSFLDEVQVFAVQQFLPALVAGASLDEGKKREIVAQTARYIGLNADYVNRANLRIPVDQFAKEFLRDDNRTTGRFDGRFLGIDNNKNGCSYEYDPALSAILGPFNAVMNNYVRNDLKFQTDLEYRVLTDVFPWKYQEVENQPLDVSGILANVMTRNPNMNVFIANGYYDLATPYFATLTTVAGMNLDPSIRPHLQMRNYRGGHMMYLESALLIELNRDLNAFIQKTVDQPQRFIKFPLNSSSKDQSNNK